MHKSSDPYFKCSNDLKILKSSHKHHTLASYCLFSVCVCPGSRSAASSSPSAGSQTYTEGQSDLLLETSYYNFYQPSRYPTYYGNLFNYQQYQVTNNNHPAVYQFNSQTLFEASFKGS